MVILDCWNHTIFIKEKSPGDNHRRIGIVSTKSSQATTKIQQRPATPNCQCSCHYHHPHHHHHHNLQQTNFPTNKSSLSSFGNFYDLQSTSHLYSTVSKIQNQTKLTNGEKNRSYSITNYDESDFNSGSCLNYHQPNRYYHHYNRSIIEENSDLYSDYNNNNNNNNSSSNYSFIKTNQQHQQAKKYHTKRKKSLSEDIYSINNKKNILYLLRIDPFKFATMEPLQVDNRLIVFSLVDTFTKLSPNKILENYVKKLIKEEGKTSITIFNLSEPLKYLKNDELLKNVPICEYGWPERRAPSLEKLCSLCKSIDSWLNLDQYNNMAIIYSKRDLSRASLCIAVFLQYIKICFGADTFFDWESMYNYYHYNLESYLQPSQRRYINYFKNLLNGDSKINNQKFHLKQIILRKIPNFDGNGLCKPFVKIYQGLKLIYSSQILNINHDFTKLWDFIVFNINPSLKLKGEILVKFYHKIMTPRSRTEMFSFQFHTGTLTNNQLIFNKKELDISLPDKRFHDDTHVQLIFNDQPLESVLQQVDFIEDDNQITKCNSYENFFTDANLEYTKGPLDGSLYATVSKKPIQTTNTRTLTSTTTDQNLSSKTAKDEMILDELINEIFSEIQSFPDASTSNLNLKSEDNYDYVTLRKSPTTPKINPNFDEKENVDLALNDQQSILSDGGNTIDLENLDWLQRQQLKLKLKQNRKEFVEKRLIEELKSTITNGKHQPVAPEIPERKSSRNILSEFNPELNDFNYYSDQIDGQFLCNQHPSEYQQLQLSIPNQNDLDSLDLKQQLQQPNSIIRSSTPAFPVRTQQQNQSKLKHTNTLHSNGNSGNLPLFIKDTSAFWYKPNISREEAVRYLSDKPSGYFIIRNSNSFPNAYGLAVKVPLEEAKSGDPVRHFLIESTNKGVQIKGCPEEPVFSSLAALVYQHSITRISLPVVLIIPSTDIENGNGNDDHYLKRFYENGAACNVLYFLSNDIESLTGPIAIKKLVNQLFEKLSTKQEIKPAVIHFKASLKGITLTDNSHRLFFRQHYPLKSISFCSMDPENRSWFYNTGQTKLQSHLFGFVSRKKNSNQENICLIFGHYESDQPSHAIVDFVNKLIMNS